MARDKRDKPPYDLNISICGFKLKEKHFITEDSNGKVNFGCGCLILIILMLLFFML